MSTDKISNQISAVISSLPDRIEANWEKHKVAIIAGAAITAGGILIAASGGLLAVPAAVGVALVAGGIFAAGGGLGFTAYVSLQGPDSKIDNDDADDSDKGSEIPTAAPVTTTVAPVEANKDPEVEENQVEEEIVQLPSTPNIISPYSPPRDEKEEEKENPEFMGSDADSLLFNPASLASSSPVRSIAFGEASEDPQVGNESIPSSSTPLPSPSRVVTVTQDPSLPSGSLVKMFHPGFTYSPAPIAATEKNEEAVKEEAVKEEAVKEEAVKEEAVKEEAVVVEQPKATPSPLKNDKIDDDMLLYREEAPEETAAKEAKSLRSYIPSGRTVVKASAYLTGAAALAMIGYIGYHVAQQLSGGECPADATRRTLGEYYATRLISLFNSLGTTSSEALDDGQCSIFDEPMRRGYIEYYGQRLLNATSSGYNSLPSQESFESWMNDPTWGNTSEQILQRMMSADPIGYLNQTAAGQAVRSFTEQAGTCASAVGEYLNSTETPGQIQTLSEVLESCPFTSSGAQPSLEDLGIPFADLTNLPNLIPAEQLMVQEAIRELTTCPMNGPVGALAADNSQAFIEHLLSLRGK